MELTYNKNYLSSHCNDWEDIYKNLFNKNLEEIDEQVWESVRRFSYEDAPLLEKVYQFYLLSELSSLIEEMIKKEIPSLKEEFVEIYELEFDNTSSSYADFMLKSINQDDETYLEEDITDIESVKSLLNKLKAIHNK